MIKHKLSKLALALLTVLGTVGSASAVTIDFDSTAAGGYSSLTIGGVTITFLGGSGAFDVVSASPGAPISGNALLSYYTNPGSASFQATFAGGASTVSIGVGDYNADEDHAHLRAYDAANNLLDTDAYVNPASTYGGAYLTVSSSTSIARVEWNEDSYYAGAVYWDNLSYDAASSVPEPGSLSLMALGLMLTGFAARRRRAGK